MKTRAVAYLRVSTEKQVDHGVSLEAQRAKVEAYAKLYDLDLVAVIVDGGVSGKTLDRPGLNRALTMLRKGEGDALLVSKLDRLTRSVRDLGNLVERFFAAGKWALLSVADQIDTRSASGRLVLNILGSLAQWEREATGERTATAMAHKASCGEYIGGNAPYGFRLADDGVHVVQHGAEQAVVRQARALRAEGLSLRGVARELTRQGFVSRVGKPFVPVQIARMLQGGDATSDGGHGEEERNSDNPGSISVAPGLDQAA